MTRREAQKWLNGERSSINEMLGSEANPARRPETLAMMAIADAGYMWQALATLQSQQPAATESFLRSIEERLEACNDVAAQNGDDHLKLVRFQEETTYMLADVRSALDRIEQNEESNP